MYRRLRELREHKGITQAQISKVLNCSRDVYGKYERGEADISALMLMALAQFHKVSVDYLLNRIDDSAPYARK